MIKAVLFDLDGTVINSNDLVIGSWRHTLKENLGFYPDDDEIIRSFGEPLAVTAKRYDENKIEMIMTAYRHFNVSMHDSMIKEYEGMNEALKTLKSFDIKVGIVTSKRKIMAERGLKKFGLFDMMDVIVAMEDTAKHKPDGDPLKKALEILNLLPEDALYVGDTHLDILCGKDAGCRTCVVRYSLAPFEELMKYNPDYVIDKPLDLVELVHSEKTQVI
jgi:pyrophosphatase PpaX